MKVLTSLWLVTILTLSGCAAAPEPAVFDVTGIWEYSLTASDGNTYDAGSIVFDGSPESGTYLLLNIYNIEYSGTYTVSGIRLQLAGDENWQGTLLSSDRLEGTFEYSDASGAWTAVKLP
ncbi:MAG: hypothetical protein FJZ96_09460 [Chloroflexi bacterium]|nr:hypothetical protein [Chloroflexota bacterium]